MQTDLRIQDSFYDIEDNGQWNSTINCSLLHGEGYIYTHSASKLGFIYTLSSNPTTEDEAYALKLRHRLLKHASINQEGDFEFSVLFDLEHLDDIAKLVGAV